MSPDPNSCARCGQKKAQSSAGSITQWISVCHCDLQDVNQELTANICVRCGERIGGGRAGSLTQWVFRNKVCQCAAPDPVVAMASLPDYAINADKRPGKFADHGDREPLVNEDEDPFEGSEIDVDPLRFPLDRYRPLRTLGAGGAGTVYLCWDKHLQKRVAVKVLLDLTHDSQIGFQKEAVVTAKIKHKNVVNIIDFGVVDDGPPYMVLEYFSGAGLDHYLKQNGPPDVAVAIKFFFELADALAYGHEANVFHRDIKCSNVLVVEDEHGNPTLKLIDYGIAAIIQNQSATNVQGRTLVGTPKYMSPDQAMGFTFDARSELYSLGCLMFEVLTGRVPFDGEDALDLITKHSSEPVPAMSEVALGALPPIELENLVRKCLEKDPDNRYQSMNELKRALASVELEIGKSDASYSALSRRVIPYVAPPAMPDWLTPRIVLITILFLLILVGTYAMLAFRSDGGAIKSTQPVEKVKLKGSRARSARKKMVQIYDAPLPHFDKSMALERGYFTFHNLATGGVEAKSPNDVLVDRQSLATLQNRTDLAAINVARSRFDGSGLELVADLPNLHTLDLTDTEVTDKAFENIQRMHKLLGLHVEGCYAITDESLRYLTKLPLRFLNIRRTDIGDLGLSYLKESKTLHTLNMTMARKVTAKGILALRGIKSLTSMNVDFKDRPVEFFEALASLKFPNLCVESSDYATMSDPVIDTLGGFKIINFSKIKFSEEQLRRLSCSKHLNTVSFHMGGITDAHVRAMSNSSFQSIGILEDAIFNDRALLELKKLKHLKEIYLSLVPHVTAKGRELLHKARPDINFVQP